MLTDLLAVHKSSKPFTLLKRSVPYFLRNFDDPITCLNKVLLVLKWSNLSIISTQNHCWLTTQIQQKKKQITPKEEQSAPWQNNGVQDPFEIDINKP